LLNDGLWRLASTRHDPTAALTLNTLNLTSNNKAVGLSTASRASRPNRRRQGQISARQHEQLALLAGDRQEGRWHTQNVFAAAARAMPPFTILLRLPVIILH